MMAKRGKQGFNAEKSKQGFQPVTDGRDKVPTSQPAHLKSVPAPAAESTPSRGVDDVYSTYRAKTLSLVEGAPPAPMDTTPADVSAPYPDGVVDTRKYGTYVPTSEPINHWQVAEGLTIEWQPNPLVPGRDTARVELDIPELSGRSDDVRALLRDGQPGEALRALSTRLRALADEIDDCGDNLD